MRGLLFQGKKRGWVGSLKQVRLTLFHQKFLTLFLLFHYFIFLWFFPLLDIKREGNFLFFGKFLIILVWKEFKDKNKMFQVVNRFSSPCLAPALRIGNRSLRSKITVENFVFNNGKFNSANSGGETRNLSGTNVRFLSSFSCLVFSFFFFFLLSSFFIIILTQKI